MSKEKQIVQMLLIILFGGVCFLFLYWHYQLGLTRYFDADEFAHLHWASEMLAGKKPYIDFLTFFPPGFAWFLTPVFMVGWGTVQPFISARLLIWIVFVMMCAASGVIFYEVRKNIWGACLAALLLSFLPMPFDKYLEIRPDNPATLLLLLAIYAQIRYIKEKDVICLKKWQFTSGVFYALSYIVLPKMVPNIAIGIFIAYIYAYFSQLKPGIRKIFICISQIKYFIYGLAAPIAVFALWAITLGDPQKVWYSLFVLPIESNKISQIFIMMQDLFFYPNGIYYGIDGWSRPVYVNHVIWIAGLLIATFRLITPFNIGNKKQSVIPEILIALQFWVQLIFYIQIVPLKHAQYLIPIGVFISWYVADGIAVIGQKMLVNRFTSFIFLIISIISVFYLYDVFIQGNSPKLGWTNKDTLSQMQTYYQNIPKTEYVLDLTGTMLYNPDPYYACCIPFGQFAAYLSQPLPDLPTVLAKTNTKYIAQGGLKRVSTLPWPWQQYIYKNYHAWQGDEMMLVKNDASN